MKVWVVHLDDAAPSSGFEGVFSSLEAAKRLVGKLVDDRYAERFRWHAPDVIPLRGEIAWSESPWSIEAYWDGCCWVISEEEVHD